MMQQVREREKTALGSPTAFEVAYAALNERQRQAVDTIEGPVMVVAGPGTGKTQVLAMRVANILTKTQMDPWNILCLTFTESGVVAMRERLLSIIGAPAYYVRIHTFHSLCNEIIQAHPEIFAIGSDWQALADIERVELLQKLLDDRPGTSPLKPFGNPYLFLKDLVGNIQDLKQEDVSPERFGEILQRIEALLTATVVPMAHFQALKPSARSEAACREIYEGVKAAAQAAQLPLSLTATFQRFYERYNERLKAADEKRAINKANTAFKNDIKRWLDTMRRQLPKWRELQQVYTQYGKRLTQQGRYDYEDMILKVVAAWQKQPDLLAEYQEQFQYILVDEYQDTNGAQNEVVQLLGEAPFDAAQGKPNIFVVGDDKQSIYRFQGASLNNMLAFFERYREKAQLVSLADNYRSQATVLAAAQAVIEQNEEALAKYLPGIEGQLAARAGRQPEPLALQTFASESEEDYFVVQQVQGWLAAGVPARAIAVLYRYNRDGQEVLRQLRAAGVPVRLEAGENVLGDTVVRQFLRLLTYVAGRDRNELLAELIQYSWWNIDPLKTLQLMHEAGRRRRDLLMALREDAATRPLISLLASWRALAANVTLQDLLQHVLTESGLLAWALQQDGHVAVLKRLNKVLEHAKLMNRGRHEATLKDFVREVELMYEHEIALTIEPWQVGDGAVRLMTAHKAKGLEFERVIITRLNDKHWGNNPAPNKISLPHGLVRFDTIVAQENNEDERRLFYVALTRAKQTVVLTRATHNGSGRETVPSLFLQELPADLVAAAQAAETDEKALERIQAAARPVPLALPDEAKAWIKELVTKHVLSVTHLNNYLECPRKFYIQNLLQVPSARTLYQALGTAIHAALDRFFAEFRQRQTLPGKEFLLEAFTQALTREVLTPVDLKDIAAVGQEHLSAYYDYYQSEWQSNALGEYDFRPHRVHVDDIPITGKIDKLEALGGEFQAGGPVVVVDYKTGDVEKGLRKLAPGGDYHRQLVFYKLLCQQSAQFPYRMEAGEIDFVQASRKSGKFVKKRLTITDKDVSELTATVKRVWQEIQALKFLEEDSGCGKCEHCQAF